MSVDVCFRGVSVLQQFMVWVGEAQIPGFWNPMVKWCNGIFSDQKSSPTRGWAFVPTGLYFLLPVMRINLQVLAGSGGMIVL